METFATIGEWAVCNFGTGKPLACYAKLAEEFGEVARPLQKQDYDKAVLEMADVVIVLSHMARSINRDLQRAVEDKMLINKARMWQMTKEGTAVHVQENITVPKTNVGCTADNPVGQVG